MQLAVATPQQLELFISFTFPSQVMGRKCVSHVGRQKMVNKECNEGTVLQPQLLTNKFWEENTINHVGTTKTRCNCGTPLQQELLTNKYWEGNAMERQKMVNVIEGTVLQPDQQLALGRMP